MQNKYKIPPDVRETVIRLVKGYDRRKRKITNAEREITSLDGTRFETHGNERVYTPNGKGGASSPTEVKALRLAKLHESFDYKCVQAIDEARQALPITHYPHELAEKIRRTIIISCALGKKFRFRYSGITGIVVAHFYRLRSQFIFSVAEKLDLL